jgi:hypothetical protein
MRTGRVVVVRLARLKMARTVAVVGTSCVVAWAVYASAVFVATFELSGPAVRNDRGWLGPTPRGTRCVEDIGKINYWICADTAIFQRHQLGSTLWLNLNGFG